MKRLPWTLFLSASMVIGLAVCRNEQPIDRPAQPLAAQATAPAAAPAQPAAEAEPSNPCNTGPVNNPNQPILCVDDGRFPAISVLPESGTPVHVNASKTVHWFTKSGTGTIGIVYDSELLDAPAMQLGRGHTKAKAGTKGGSVKYSIVVQRANATSAVIDPTIIIDTNTP